MRSLDRTSAREDLQLTTLTEGHDAQRWRCHTKLEKFEGDIVYDVRGPGLLIPHAATSGALITPYETDERDGNLLLIGGASVQWQTLIGNGTATVGQALTFFNNANAAIGVGDSTTAAVDTQTALQGAVNVTDRQRVAMDATYPLHTDTTGTAGSKSITFRSTFATTLANFAWQEWGIFNSATDATGRMLNRKVESLGTKTSAATWVLTITLSLA